MLAAYCEPDSITRNFVINTIWLQFMSKDNIFRNIRFYVLVINILISIGVYFLTLSYVPDGYLQIIRLTQIYAFLAVINLYLALLIGPLCFTFRFLPYFGQIVKARRATGVSVFLFAVLHVKYAFFDQLGGFAGLGFLSSRYLLAISLSALALLILFLMTLTSFDFIIKKMTYPKWKFLHKFVYLAGIFILIHALLLGTHFRDLSGAIPQIFFLALLFLLVLEALRIDAWLKKKFTFLPAFGPAVIITLIFFAIYFFKTTIQR